VSIYTLQTAGTRPFLVLTLRIVLGFLDSVASSAAAAGYGERPRQVPGRRHWQRQLGQRSLPPHRLQHRQVARLPRQGAALRSNTGCITFVLYMAYTDYLQLEPPLVLDLTSTHAALCLCAPI
jgi:hypothetical protein